MMSYDEAKHADVNKNSLEFDLSGSYGLQYFFLSKNFLTDNASCMFFSSRRNVCGR